MFQSAVPVRGPRIETAKVEDVTFKANAVEDLRQRRVVLSPIAASPVPNGTGRVLIRDVSLRLATGK
jgi:hypothetical protein